MIPDSEETIVAISSAKGAADRGIIRVAGPRATEIVEHLSSGSLQVPRATRLPAVDFSFDLAGDKHSIAVDLFVWPDDRSYTQQPAVEIHTIGSLPILEAVERAIVEAGARLAAPGEFTLRAFMAGRIDLIQAEAVLAVIDAQHEQLLEVALQQLAGGLSGPLNKLREGLLSLLADLEAGLDFVEEEDVQFVEQAVLINRLKEALKLIIEAESKTENRSIASSLPMALIMGEPNVGKSRLFNTLVQRYGIDKQSPTALVADQPGVTRDSLRATLSIGGFMLQLSDSAGVEKSGDAIDEIDALSQKHATDLQTQADLRLICLPASRSSESDLNSSNLLEEEHSLIVQTMADLTEVGALEETPNTVATSSLTGFGIEELADRIANHLLTKSKATASEVVADTANRCRESLAEARLAIERSIDLANLQAGDELVSHEIRVALESLGRVVGAIVTDDVLDQIFSKFCIGK